MYALHAEVIGLMKQQHLTFGEAAGQLYFVKLAKVEADSTLLNTINEALTGLR